MSVLYYTINQERSNNITIHFIIKSV